MPSIDDFLPYDKSGSTSSPVSGVSPLNEGDISQPLRRFMTMNQRPTNASFCSPDADGHNSFEHNISAAGWPCWIANSSVISLQDRPGTITQSWADFTGAVSYGRLQMACTVRSTPYFMTKPVQLKLRI